MDSIKLKDKRRISLLNTDFKILTGIENDRHGRMLDCTVSDVQFVLGKTRNISYAIAAARDAIWCAENSTEGAGLADLDFMSAFDLLCMDWVYAVLKKRD